MKPRASLPHSQEPTTCLSSEPDQSSPCVHPGSWRTILILPSHACLGLPSCLIPSGFLTKTLFAPFFYTCYTPCPSPSTWFDHPNNTWWERSTEHNSLCKLALVNIFFHILCVFISRDLHIRITYGGNKTQTSCAVQKPASPHLWVTSLSLLRIGSVLCCYSRAKVA